MKKILVGVFAGMCMGTAFAEEPAYANPEPLYIVNGERAEDIKNIPPDDIEHVEMLPADDETIAKYGNQAAHGVILVSLRYDTPAAFEAAESFSDYIAGQVRWEETDPVARIILRFTVTPEGKAVVEQELESTDSRLKRRVLKALEEAPLWKPAMKNGAAIASKGILKVQLPEGREMPRQAELVWR